jgi:anti-anti-sigma factor
MNTFGVRRRELSAGMIHLELAGEIDLGVSGDLTAAQLREIESPGVAGLIVDLQQVTFLDSTGIAALVAGYRAARQRGIGFVVTNPHHHVKAVLQVTGVLGPLTDSNQTAPVLDHPTAVESENQPEDQE